MKQMLIILLSFGVLLSISGCAEKYSEPPKPLIINTGKLPQVPYPEVTNDSYDTLLDNSKQCVVNYYLMKEAFIECSNNAKAFQ